MINNCCEQAIKESHDFSFVCWLVDKHTELAFELQDEYNKYMKRIRKKRKKRS